MRLRRERRAGEGKEGREEEGREGKGMYRCRSWSQAHRDDRAGTRTHTGSLGPFTEKSS